MPFTFSPTDPTVTEPTTNNSPAFTGVVLLSSNLSTNGVFHTCLPRSAVRLRTWEAVRNTNSGRLGVAGTTMGLA